MSNDRESNQKILAELIEGLEHMRDQLVDLEALAHAAEQVIARMPDILRPDADPASALDEVRRDVGRMQSYMVATAESARSLLAQIDELLGRTDPSGFNGNGSNGSNGHGASRCGEPRVPYFVAPGVPGGLMDLEHPASRRARNDQARALEASYRELAREVRAGHLPADLVTDMLPGITPRRRRR